MPLIWNNQLQAFEESEPPMTYNPVIEAWQDTEGYEHNSELDAWEKIWPTKLWLYNQGDECADVTGGWSQFAGTGSYDKSGNVLTVIGQAGASGEADLSTNKPISFDEYKTLNFNVVYTDGGIGNSVGYRQKTSTEAVATTLSGQTGIISFPISGVTGLCFPIIIGWNYSYAHKVTIDKIWLE